MQKQAVQSSACPSRVERELVMLRKESYKGADDALADLGFEDNRHDAAQGISGSSLQTSGLALTKLSTTLLWPVKMRYVVRIAL
jgi:hypothetical protein